MSEDRIAGQEYPLRLQRTLEDVRDDRVAAIGRNCLSVEASASSARSTYQIASCSGSRPIWSSSTCIPIEGTGRETPLM